MKRIVVLLLLLASAAMSVQARADGPDSYAALGDNQQPIFGTTPGVLAQMEAIITVNDQNYNPQWSENGNNGGDCDKSVANGCYFYQFYDLTITTTDGVTHFSQNEAALSTLDCDPGYTAHWQDFTCLATPNTTGGSSGGSSGGDGGGSSSGGGSSGGSSSGGTSGGSTGGDSGGSSGGTTGSSSGGSSGGASSGGSSSGGTSSGNSTGGSTGDTSGGSSGGTTGGSTTGGTTGDTSGGTTSGSTGSTSGDSTGGTGGGAGGVSGGSAGGTTGGSTGGSASGGTAGGVTGGATGGTSGGSSGGTSSGTSGGTTGETGTYGGGDSCDAPPDCSGDAIECGQVKQEWDLRCGIAYNSNDANPDDPTGSGVQDLSDSVKTVTSDFSSWAPTPSVDACSIAPLVIQVLGETITIQFDAFCQIANTISILVQMSAMVVGWGIITGYRIRRGEG